MNRGRGTPTGNRGRGGGFRGGRGGRGGSGATREDHSMAQFNYSDLTETGLGFNPSPVPASIYPQASPAGSGASTPNRAPRGGGRGRGARGRGGDFANSPSLARGSPRGAGSFSPVFNGPGSRGRGGGLGARGQAAASPFSAREGRGRGGIAAGRGGAVVGGQGYQGTSGRGSQNPLLVPVMFVKATNPGFGTVGGKDDDENENKENVNGLEKAGAEAMVPTPRRALQDTSQEGSQLVESIRQMELDDDVQAKSVPKLATRSHGHPGIGAAPYPHIEPLPHETAPPSPVSTSPEPTKLEQEEIETPREDSPHLFEISTERSTVILDSSIAPPTIPSDTHLDEPSSSSAESSEGEQIVYPPRGRAQVDPVLTTRAPPPPSAPATISPSLTTTTAPGPPSKPPTISLNIRSASSYPTSTVSHLEQNPYVPPSQRGPKLSKKQQKKASKIARRKGKAHARSGNFTQRAGGRKLVEDDEDRREGEEMLARMGMFRGGGGSGTGVDDMLDLDDDDSSDEDGTVDAEGHVDGQPRMDDSDVEWGTTAPPALKRGKAKRDVQRQQRDDQREAEKLQRLLDAGGTREEVELRLALEMSIAEDKERKRSEKESRRREREREREMVVDDYATNVAGGEDGELDEEDLAVMRSFARNVVGGPKAEHKRGGDLDRVAAEEEDDEDAWNTSEDDSEALNTDEEDYRRNLGLESESSEDVDSDVELEMDYSLGDADGRIEHELSIESSSEDESDSSFDSSASTSTTSSAENRAIEAALLSGRTLRLQSMGSKPSAGSQKKAEKERKLEKKRMRKGKGKEQAWYEEKGGDSDDSSDDDSIEMGEDFGGGGEVSWAEQDEDFIARMQRTVHMNADLLSTAAGGKHARRANRKDRNKLFKAISNGNFEDVEFDYDLDEAEAIERMIADEEDEMMYGTPGGSKRKNKNKKGRNFDGAFSESLASQWDLDRQKKAVKKNERAAARAAANEADSRDAPKYGKKPKGKTSSKYSPTLDSRNDASTMNSIIREFIVYDLTGQTLDLPPMSKKSRIAVHLLAEVYGLKSRSMGSGKHRFPVLERTRKTTIAGVSERRIRAIVGTADGENELDDGYGYGGRGGKSKTGKVGGLWKALEGASGKKAGRGGGGGSTRKNNEGAVVGQGADKVGSGNVGFALLKKMGWTEGGQIGVSGGIHEPIAARIKTGKHGLGSGFMATRGEMYNLAKAPERDWDE